MMCTGCKGTGRYVRLDGKQVSCIYCDGVGTFPEPDLSSISAEIFAGGKIRVSPPKTPRNTVFGRRVYFVWRIARFYGGQDVHMPFVAETLIWRDPYEKVLDELAANLARVFFGTDLAGPLAWKGILF